MTGDEIIDELFDMLEEQGIAVEGEISEVGGGQVVEGGQVEVGGGQIVEGGQVEPVSHEPGSSVAESNQGGVERKDPRVSKILRVIGHGINIADVYEDPALFKLMKELVHLKVFSFKLFIYAI